MSNRSRIIRPLAFTVKARKGIVNAIVTYAKLIAPDSTKICLVRAMWDTGSTRSAISEAMAKQLELVSVGSQDVYTANGITIQNNYKLHVELPNHIFIKDVIVGDFPTLDGGIDALIGMDIITLGDFSITNHHQTCMSFRIPSCHELDYSITHT